MENKYTIINGELYHYGVPGMKWGKRKALNKMLKYERKMNRYQDAADHHKNMYKLGSNARNIARGVFNKNVSIKGKAGGLASQAINTAKNQNKHANTQAADLRAAKSAARRGAKAAKAQAKADKWKRKLDKVADKKKIDLGNKTVSEYILKQTKDYYQL